MNWLGMHSEVNYKRLVGSQKKRKKERGKARVCNFTGKTYGVMAGGSFAVDGPATGLNGKITVSVVITCIVAASSGLIFGYDIGISG